MKLIAVILICILCSACGSFGHRKQVVIEGEGVKLVYQCGDFKSQIKTGDDGRAVLVRANDIMAKAIERENIPLARSIRIARSMRDELRLEELIVKAECEWDSQRK